jgi:hypothetical protein
MRIIDSRSPTNPLVAIGSDLRAGLVLDLTLPDAINRLTAALDRAESTAADLPPTEEPRSLARTPKTS